MKGAIVKSFVLPERTVREVERTGCSRRFENTIHGNSSNVFGTDREIERLGLRKDCRFEIQISNYVNEVIEEYNKIINARLFNSLQCSSTTLFGFRATSFHTGVKLFHQFLAMFVQHHFPYFFSH